MECAGCSRPITDRFALFAINRNWHDDCLQCACCNCHLAELGWTFYFRQSMTLCLRDYVRLYGVEGHCALCEKTIGALELVMHADRQIFHLRCFACQSCNGRFCIGERFRLKDGKIFCYDNCRNNAAK